MKSLLLFLAIGLIAKANAQTIMGSYRVTGFEYIMPDTGDSLQPNLREAAFAVLAEAQMRDLLLVLSEESMTLHWPQGEVEVFPIDSIDRHQVFYKQGSETMVMEVVDKGAQAYLEVNGAHRFICRKE